MVVMRRVFLSGLVLALAQGEARAWDGIVTANIVQLDVTDANNCGVRVYLDGAPTMCGTGSAVWAFLPAGFSNYAAAVSLMTSAWLAGKPVTLHTTRVGGAFCEIGYIMAR